MRRLRSVLAAWLLLCGAAACDAGGCKGGAPESPVTGSSSDAGPTSGSPASEGMIPAIGGENHSLYRLASGTMDVGNRYASTLMLTANARTRVASCSGILLNQRVALTAASCVCLQWEDVASALPKKRFFDASACAEHAFLKTVHYGAVGDWEYKEQTTVKSFRTLKGTVRVHPGFKLEFDAQGAALTSHADLAVIVLDSPLKERLPFVPLSESEVQENETLVMAGYASDARFGGFAGIRYFRQNKVTRAPEVPGGRVLYEQRAPFLYNGYTGGPCIREDKNHQWLVGIASVGSDRDLSFTSTYYFRDWLRAELQRAATTRSHLPPQSPSPGEKP